MNKKNLIYINGEWIESKSENFIDVINPANEEVIASVVECTEEEVDLAVEKAKEAFKLWKKTPLSERKMYLKNILQGIEENKDLLADIITQELGAPVSFSLRGQVELSINEMSALLDEIDNYEFEKDMFGSKVLKEPAGVVAAITPWNWPLNQIQRKLTPALLGGNTMVCKPASGTPLTALKFTEIIHKSGLPKGVFNLVTGSGSKIGEYLASHKDVSVISFTGSTEVGRNMYNTASKGIKKLIMELGGKSPLIFLKGGDRNIAVKNAMNAIINNQGQSCSALTRLFIPKEEEKEFRKLLLDYAMDVKMGDPLDESMVMGPLVSREQMNKVLKFIESGIEEGAEVLVGGERKGDKGFFIEPTVFMNVENDMNIARNEIFGPVLSVITYDNEEEAIDMANDTTYGLSGCVVGPIEEAIKVASQIDSGNVYINDGVKSPKVPFGGYKESGLGREVGIHGVDDYMETKAIILPKDINN